MKKKLLTLLFITSMLKADQYSFIFYNDFFAGTDKHFTNGMALSWIDGDADIKDENTSNAYSSFMRDAITIIPFVNNKESKNYNAGISISQAIITPSDISEETPQYDDIPYAGYLAISFYLFQWDNNSFDEFRADIGVVGEESGAEFVQNAFHKIIGSKEAKGWDTQLGTQYTINTLYRHGDITWQRMDPNSVSMDWFNQIGLEVGNFTTDAFVTTIFRVGQNYIRNFNVHYPYLREEAAILKLDDDHKGFGWSFSLGLNGQALAYSYILDQAVKEGYDTDKNTFSGSLYGGVDLYYNLHKFTFLYQSHSPYTQEESKADIFGGFVYSYQF